MDDEQVMERMDEIAHEEHQLWEKEGRGRSPRPLGSGSPSIRRGTSCTSDEPGGPRAILNDTSVRDFEPSRVRTG